MQGKDMWGHRDMPSASQGQRASEKPSLTRHWPQTSASWAETVNPYCWSHSLWYCVLQMQMVSDELLKTYIAQEDFPSGKPPRAVSDAQPMYLGSVTHSTETIPYNKHWLHASHSERHWQNASNSPRSEAVERMREGQVNQKLNFSQNPRFPLPHVLSDSQTTKMSALIRTAPVLVRD